MNKIAKRVVAGISAAALFVSALGSDALISLFNPTTYAASSSGSGVIGKDKNGQSTGFDNLEQDTLTVADGTTYYNTGYGLHTNKTATEADTDGRTFDVNLESWYVGENPVDVATILDASGSMAWTVDTLEPLEIGDHEKELEGFVTKYSISDTDLSKYDYDDNKTLKILAAIQDQNYGYLPQEVVDVILDNTKTDNSKLSYSDYMYYIYESRSTVSEFVPLGYWDGGEPTKKLEPIGYYPFNGTLENKADKAAAGAHATVIKNTNEGTAFEETAIKETAAPAYNNSGDKHEEALYLNDSVNNGAVLLDVSKEGLLSTGAFSVLFQTNGNDLGSGNTDIIYIGNLRNTENGIRIFYDEKGNLKIKCNTTEIDTGNDCTDGWQTFKFVFEDSEVKFTVGKGELSVLGGLTFDLSGIVEGDFGIIVGGLINGGEYEGINNLQIDNVYLFNKALSDTDVQTLETNFSGTVSSNIVESNLKSFGDSLVGLYSFDSNSLENSSTNSSTTSGKYIKQNSGTGFDKTSTPATSEATAEYSSDGKSLSINNLGKKNRAVLLDVNPSGDYTISFEVQVTSSDQPTTNRNIMYIGKNDTSAYYTWYRKKKSSQNQLKLFEKDGINEKGFTDKVFGTINEWKKITFVVEKGVLKFYCDGVEYTSTYTLKSGYGTDQLSIILAGLLGNSYDKDDIFVKNVYVFDEALEPDEVALVAKNQLMVVPSALTTGCKGFHAVSQDGDAIAQISTSLGQNPNDDERAGWYYVNSHSTWEDIKSCLEGGKQYLGVLNDEYLAKKPTNPTVFGDSDNSHVINSAVNEDDIKNNNKSIATVPSVYQAAYDDYITAKESNDGIKPEDALGEERADYYYYYEYLKDGDDEDKTFTPAETERSLQFYIDSKGYLRCFYCTGEISWKRSDKTWGYNQRTFCSVVYVKEKYEVEERIAGNDNYGDPTKYEELNYALNQFYQNLAKYSDLSNSAIVRFSTHNLIQGNSEEEVAKNAVDHLKMLIMKDWTNYSDVYSKNDSSTREEYLQDLLTSKENETSTSTEPSSARVDINEYPYVMTGGTYTWTGLKAFYDNMVNTEELKSGDTVYNIANDARDKYLIIFTDGRDNTIDSDDTKYVNDFEKDKNGKVTSYGDFAPEGYEADTDAKLAKAWADKLKDEGYTIFCVMLATGSISETTNEAEYNKAKTFLLQLAGDKDGEREPEECISVVGADSTLETAFADILTKIQQPRNDYTVQDYIDPRFDLIGKDADGNDVTYYLGAGGKITVTKNGEAVGSLTTFDGTNSNTVSGNAVTVGNIIDSIDKGTTAIGLAYTPRESYMVNRVQDSDGNYTTGDGIGTGYIYYDDVKDMYYLRWTDQIIPMENEAFDTAMDPEKKLDVWSATIRLKAKDDFIGGNNILTNGNEAGENLVYSDATIENMDKGENYELYGFTGDDLDLVTKKVPYRKKLEALSGTNRKINAVDAGGVSQAVYGDGIDIPSSGFPRTTVNVRLLPLNANNLNDVIYMGEVVSPTMMLADLENGYMTGSYYLEYLERYAYRLYGYDAAKTPLLELLNQWLKINDKDEKEKTFTIPYIYLPDPVYEGDTLKVDGGKVVVNNNTGMSTREIDITGGDKVTIADFVDPNLRDVTGFITYTWKRDDGGEEQQKVDTDGDGVFENDITINYVVKNTDQIKYNLQLKFTPLKETKDGLDGFELDKNFIKKDSTTSTGGDSFFKIINKEFDVFEPTAKDEGWSTEYGREDYLKAMIQEKHTYEPHVMYDTGHGKWVLVDEKSDDRFKPAEAVEAYAKDESTIGNSDGTVTDSGVYDWDTKYKEAAGKVQLEGSMSGDKLDTIKGCYTDTPNNVKMLDASGAEITDETGKVTGINAPCSLAANTTYTKDVVNAALALELFVDGKYLIKGSPLNPNTGNKTFTFEATRYYDDPIDPLPYDSTETSINADTGNTDPTSGKVEGKKYRLTFEVTDIPADATANELSRVWANLTKVEVEDDTSGYVNITNEATASNPYLGYDKPDALPIGTYVIDTATNPLNSDIFKIADVTEGGLTETLYFKYLKIDNDVESYTHGRFPDNVSSVSGSAVTSTGDGEYQIWNDSVDYSKKNIAENDRTKTSTNQTVTFYFGTVKDDSGDKGKSVKDYLKANPEATSSTDFTSDYAKDRLGIITLSADNNSLAISKKVTNTTDYSNSWEFTVTVKLDTAEDVAEFADQNIKGFDLKWYKLEDGTWKLDETAADHDKIIKFDAAGDGTYTAIITLKHGEKVVISGLQDGTWQVEEEKNGTLLYTPHNNANGEENWEYVNSNITSADVQLNPASHVDFVNEFPYELPSAGGFGIVIFVVLGSLLSAAAVIFFVLGRRKAGYSAGGKECG